MLRKVFIFQFLCQQLRTLFVVLRIEKQNPTTRGSRSLMHVERKHERKHSCVCTVRLGPAHIPLIQLNGLIIEISQCEPSARSNSMDIMIYERSYAITHIDCGGATHPTDSHITAANAKIWTKKCGII